MNTTRDPFRGYDWEGRAWRPLAAPLTWHYTAITRQRESEPGEPRMLDYDTGLDAVSLTRGIGAAPAETKTHAWATPAAWPMRELAGFAGWDTAQSAVATSGLRSAL